MTRCVLLRHDLPDGSHHFDWLVELPIWGEHRLLALRVPPPEDPARPPAPLDPNTPSFRAELLPLHRAFYLHHQGPIRANLGRVTRIATGLGKVLSHGAASLVIESTLAGQPSVFHGRRSAGTPQITFERAPIGPENPILAPEGTSG